jgi:hypothetical protein
MPLERELLRAYRAAQYVVFAEPELVLRIDEPNPDLDALLESYGVQSAAFISAANPHGRRERGEANAAASERLHLAASIAGFGSLEGEGRDPLRSWPAEPSWLILGVSRDQAVAFGEEFEQNAIVFCEKGRAPELLLLS